MLPQAQTGSLNNVHNTYSNHDGQQAEKLTHFIVELQGSGSQTINSIVNELVFLRRELQNDYPNDDKVRSMMKSIYKQAKRVAQTSQKYGDTLKQLCDTIKQAAR